MATPGRLRTIVGELRGSRDCQVVLVVVCVALCLRLAACYWSGVSPDLKGWQGFAQLVASQGVVKAYALDEQLNHPPLAAYLAGSCFRLGEALGVRFGVVFKLPMVLASVAAILLLWHSRTLRPGVLLLLALNPVDILLSGVQGNTDCLCAALSLLSAVLLEKRRPGLSGLALAAALNVKLIAVVIVLPFLLSIRGRGALRFLLGLAAGALPFLVVLVQDAASVYRNVIDYNSSIAGWGIHLPFILSQKQLIPELPLRAYLFYLPTGRYFVLAASALLGLVARRLRRWNTYELGALGFSIFLVIAPGFGLPYLLYPLYFLFASRLRVAVEYSLLASAFLFPYPLVWDGGLLVASSWLRPGPAPFRVFAHLMGFLAWYVLLRFVAAETCRAMRREVCPAA